ncbi:MAG: caspase family protein, partial [Rhizobiales bacterium]|nr:caspase family protein [Hyphomicrobiales bacterium]
MRHSIFSLVLVALLLAASGNVALAKRVALVIGNDTYKDVVSLQKAVNDANAIGDALESVGFEVFRAKNVVRRDMNFQLQSFYSKLQPGDEALFFYAGHGIEIAGRNFLLPTDIPSAKPGREDFIKSEAIPVDRILSSIRKRGTRVAIMVLDACRDNPFPSEGTRSLGGTRGLARMPSAEGTFIMYSAGVGQTALDRLSDDDPHPNSVFTRSLVPLIKKPGFSLTRTARLVRREVQDLAGKVSHNQRPAYYDEVTGDFFFSGKTKTVTNVPSQPAKPAPPKPSGQSGGTPSFEVESLFWSSVKDSSNPAIINTYLKKYPNGLFAELARVKLAELTKPAVTQKPKPVQPKPAKPSNNGQNPQVAVVTPPTTPTVAPTKPKPKAERVTLQASVWPIGKWPEGISSDGQNLWIAESGVRRVAQMDPTNGRVIKRVKVGRLPVDMVADPTGQVFSLIYTDGLVWSHSARGKPRRLAKLTDYPE